MSPSPVLPARARAHGSSDRIALRGVASPVIGALGVAALGALTVLSACSDPPPPNKQNTAATPPAGSGSSRAPKVPTMKPSAASASASASAPPPAVSIEVPTGPVRWTDFSGPIVKPEAKPQDKVWAAVPVSAGWDTLKFTLITVDRLSEDEYVFRPMGAEKRDIFVPGAFVFPAKPAEGLVKGDAVAVAPKDARAFGRVTSVEGGKIKVRFRYAGDQQEVEVPPDQIIKIDGTLKFGLPAAYRDLKEQEGGAQPKVTWHPGFFVHAAEDKAWIVTTSGKPIRLPQANVKPLGVQQIHKTGDKVWFAGSDTLVEATVSSVEDDGLRYKVKLAGGEETSASFESVTTPIH